MPTAAPSFDAFDASGAPPPFADFAGPLPPPTPPTPLRAAVAAACRSPEPDSVAALLGAARLPAGDAVGLGTTAGSGDCGAQWRRRRQRAGEVGEAGERRGVGSTRSV